MNRTKLRGPFMVSIDLTYTCNFSCRHCFNGSGEHDFREELSDEMLYNLSKDIGKLKPTVVCLCGGETLLRKDIAIKIAKNIKTFSEGQTIVNMVTNGYLLDENMAKEIAEADFGTIQLSLDGVDAETHEWLRRKKGSFEKVLKGIRLLKNSGVSVGIAFTPHKKNMNQLDNVYELCKREGVSELRIQPLMKLGRASESFPKEIFPSYWDYFEFARKIIKYKYENMDKPTHIDWGDPIDHLLRFSEKNFGVNPSIIINAYGDITISAYIPISFGSILKYPISKYWDSGLDRVWEAKCIQEIAKSIGTPSDMDTKKLSLPQNYYEMNVSYDILEKGCKRLFEFSSLSEFVDEVSKDEQQ